MFSASLWVLAITVFGVLGALRFYNKKQKRNVAITVKPVRFSCGCFHKCAIEQTQKEDNKLHFSSHITTGVLLFWLTVISGLYQGLLMTSLLLPAPRANVDTTAEIAEAIKFHRLVYYTYDENDYLLKALTDGFSSSSALFEAAFKVNPVQISSSMDEIFANINEGHGLHVTLETIGLYHAAHYCNTTTVSMNNQEGNAVVFFFSNTFNKNEVRRFNNMIRWMTAEIRQLHVKYTKMSRELHKETCPIHLTDYTQTHHDSQPPTRIPLGLAHMSGLVIPVFIGFTLAFILLLAERHFNKINP